MSEGRLAEAEGNGQRVALVTGAARHTGFAIAQQLIDAGLQVFVNDLDEQDVRSAVADLGPQAFAAPANVADEAQTESLVGRILEQSGRLDVLVNNACSPGVGYHFLDTPVSMLDQTLGVNLRGAYILSQYAGRAMASRKQGAIINVGSNTTTRAIVHRSAYIASKGGLDALTRAMAIDLGPLGIRVNMVAPGYIHTSRWDELPDETTRRRRMNVPLGREASATDIAQAVRFLAESNAPMTGQRLVVDGGVEVQAFPADVDL